MIKLTKTGWIILSAGILIIALASLWTIRSQQLQEQAQLEEELSLAEMKLNGFQPDELTFRQQELESHLSETLSQFETAKATLSPPIESINLTDSLFEIAKSCAVEITELSSPGLTSEYLDDIDYTVLPLTVKLEGDVTNLINFVSEVIGNFTTGVVNSVEMSIPGTTDEGEPSVIINLAIYTYEGD